MPGAKPDRRTKTPGAKPDRRRKSGPAPCAGLEEAHQPLKPIKGGVASNTVLRLIQ
ncbi:Hypothetical predicted protein, partial [Marmota monax]